MKKLLLYLGIIVVIFAGIFALDQYQDSKTNAAAEEKAQELYKTSPDKLSEETKKQLDDENYQNIIIPAEFEQKLADKEPMLVYFFSPTCHYCQKTTPTVMELSEEIGVEVLQYNVLEYRDPWDKYIQGTPTMIYFEDGQPSDLKINYGLSGDKEMDPLVVDAYEKYFNEVKNRQSTE
ncbi:thioredoxin family protein [Marinicrinis sediminis]|uniref:Thioredoxin family protein n=1 Tax=Marinicrinis sediminis TaxID=1652465 RepID=A0ABW5RA14_9BACL